MSDWIPVKQCKPPMNEPLLVCYVDYKKRQTVTIGYHDANDWVINSWYKNVRVTHWMPLPVAPLPKVRNRKDDE